MPALYLFFSLLQLNAIRGGVPCIELVNGFLLMTKTCDYDPSNPFFAPQTNAENPCVCCSDYQQYEYAAAGGERLAACQVCPSGTVQPSTSSAPCYVPCAPGTTGSGGSCSLCIRDLSISCISTHSLFAFAITQRSSSVFLGGSSRESLGERTGNLLFYFLSLPLYVEGTSLTTSLCYQDAVFVRI